MTTYRYANRAKAQLSRALTARDTTLTLVPGTGALFPETPHDNDQFALTLTSVSTPEQYEICMVLHRDGDTLTLRRGQENTTPQAFVSGDIASLNMTAGLFSLFPQAGYMGVFDQDIANRLGGYRKNAIVCDPDTPGLLWVSTQDHNTTSPTADTNSPWLTLSAGGAYLSGTEGMVPGDLQGIGLHTRGSDNAVLYKDSSNNWRVLALGSDIDAERQARQAEDTTLHNTTAALEQNKVNRSGDTMSGDLVLSGNIWNGNYYGRTLYSTVSGASANAQFQLLGNNGNECAKISVVQNNGTAFNWFLNANKTVTTPSGNNLVEISGASGATKVQSFTLKLNYIPRTSSTPPTYSVRFPEAFSSVPQVFFQIDWENSTGDNSPRTVNIAQGQGLSNNNIDQYGCNINITYTKWSNSAVDTTNGPISCLNVLAIGGA